MPTTNNSLTYQECVNLADTLNANGYTPAVTADFIAAKTDADIWWVQAVKAQIKIMQMLASGTG